MCTRATVSTWFSHAVSSGGHYYTPAEIGKPYLISFLIILFAMDGVQGNMKDNIPWNTLIV